MAEPFSTVAAAISLVDVAIKSAREISNIIASLKDAPETLRQTQEAICEVQRLLEDLKHLEDAYRKSSMAHINPQSLSSIRRAVKCIDEDLKSLRDKIGEPISNTDSRSRRFLKSLRIRNKERSIAKICSRLEQRVLFTHTALSAIGRKNDLVQIGTLATVNDNTQLVYRNQTQLRHDALSTIHSNTAASQQLLREQQQLRLDVLDGQTQLRADILNSINTNYFNNHDPIFLHEGSANDAAVALSIVRRLLPHVLGANTLQATSMGNLSWVEKAVSNILRGVHMLAASELQGRQVGVPPGTRRTTQKFAAQALHFVRSQSSSVMTQSNRSRRRSQAISMNRTEEMELAVHFSEGSLSIWITEGFQIDTAGFSYALKGFRILFVPNASRLLPGISASYLDSSTDHLKIPPAIRTFGIVPRECKIIREIRKGNVEEVQAILQRGQCSATDRDIKGRPLLMHAICNKRIDICRLLLSFGADALDCTKKGWTALQCFSRYLDPNDRRVPFAECIQLFGAYGCFDCDILVNEVNINGKVMGSYLQPPAFYACNYLLARRKVNEDQLQALITQVQDINESQFDGRTLLMQATDTHSSNMVRLANKLLRMNANSRAVDNDGQNILYFLCHRLSSCLTYTVNRAEQEDVVSLLQELISGDVPIHGSEQGYTATEMALTPAAWVLWCQALDRSGVSIENLLQDEDEFLGYLSPSSEDIHELMGDITGPEIVAPEILRDERPRRTCNICRGGIGPVYYRPPFDHHHRFITAEGLHRISPRHEDNLACKNDIHENGCTRNDHEPDGRPIVFMESLSTRKWAALWLWRNGWLPTPEDAEYWATDVITEEDLDPPSHRYATRV